MTDNERALLLLLADKFASQNASSDAREARRLARLVRVEAARAERDQEYVDGLEPYSIGDSPW